MQRGAGFLKYVIGHVYLRRTFLAPVLGRNRGSFAEASDGAQLSIEGFFKCGEDEIAKVLVHRRLLIEDPRPGWHAQVGLSRK